MEAEIWREIQAPSEIVAPPLVVSSGTPAAWSPPSPSWLKCNLASSWVENSAVSGAAWMVRDENGRAILHSRRAFSCLTSALDAELHPLLWSMESLASHHMDKVIFETSSIDLRKALLQPGLYPQYQYLISSILHHLHCFQDWSIDFVKTSRNTAATSIATSVTSDYRIQSYVASGGPFWLRNLLQKEASVIVG